jgi:hypothetical protein
VKKLTDKTFYLEFKWTVSRARDSYGYNVCTLYVDGEKVSRCNGGGYDMHGTCLGNWAAQQFKQELINNKIEHYGLTYHNPNYDPGKAIPKDTVFDGENTENKTVEQLEQEGKSLGLDRYQAFYSASSKTPTDKHIIPLIDGATGFSNVERILKKIGYVVHYPKQKKSANRSTYMVYKEEDYTQ